MTEHGVTAAGAVLLAAGGALSASLSTAFEGAQAVELLMGAAGALFGAGAAWAALRSMVSHMNESRLEHEKRTAHELEQIWDSIGKLRDHHLTHLERFHAK